MLKKMTVAMILLVGMPMALFADVSKEDLKKLCAAGISDNVILVYVKSNGPVVKLSADDVLELKRAGASNSLLATLLALPTPAAPTSPVYVPPVASDVPVAPSSTTVYPPTPAYGAPVVYDDFYPAASYSFDGGSTYIPSCGVGYGYWGGRSYGIYYGNRYCGGHADGRFVRSAPAFSGSRFVGGTFSSGVSTGGRFVGGHSAVGGGHTGSGGGHSGGGGHGGHR